MKTIVTTLLLILAVNVLMAQKTERTADIKEKRHPYSAVMDTSSDVFQVGDISVDRINMSDDSNEGAYRINMMIFCENKSAVYKINFTRNEDFDKISYRWIRDDVASITFINSTTHKRKRLMFIQLPEREINSIAATENSILDGKYNSNLERGCSISFMKESADSFFDE